MKPTTPKPFRYPRHFPLSRVKFNPPGAWPDADLKHENVMGILTMKGPYSFALHNFSRGSDGTLTPLSRAYEWRIAMMIAAGRKTLNLW